MTASFVRTVTGDIPAASLGRTDYHEHLLQSSPLMRGDELDDVARSTHEATALRSAGIDALVELTPIGLGRRPEGLRDIAMGSGMTIVASTGVHQEAHYPDRHWLREMTADHLAERFVRDLVEGMNADDRSSTPPPATDVRAGVIKVGIGYWHISTFERNVLAAAGAAHRRTGAPVVCHLEQGTAGFEVAALLEEEGVPRHRLALAHVDRNPDAELHLELAASGVYLGYDGAGRAKYWPDSVLIECLLAVARGGAADHILLGGDVARRSSFASYGGLPGMAYLPTRFIPRLTAAAGPALLDAVLVTNPARLLAWPA